MRVAVLSDLHDNLTNWQIIAKQLKKEVIDVLLFCGDLCAPDTLKEMGQDFSKKIYLVHGNVADRQGERETAEQLNNAEHLGDLGELSLDNKKIAINHYPDQAKELAESGKYDYVFYGHNHSQNQEKIGDTILINPGTAGGMFEYPSYALVDLASGQVEFINITL